MQPRWTSVVYAFFGATPLIEYDANGRRRHVFECLNRGCRNRRVGRYLGTKDAGSTGNMHRHVVRCWGEDAISRIKEIKTMKDRRAAVRDYRQNGTITRAFQLQGKKVTFRATNHTKSEARCVEYR